MTMLYGSLMAAADSVPGVSGGTIAFILGFYEQFIGALHDIIGSKPNKRRAAAAYLAKFGVGWAASMCVCVFALSRIFESEIYIISSLFLGLTAAAIPLIAIDERECLRSKPASAAFAVIGAAVVVILTALRSHLPAVGAADLSGLGAGQYAYLTLSGALAVSAMLLPGISGSTLLLIMGVYVPLLNAARQALCLNFACLPALIAAAAGAAAGMAFASGRIRSALRLHRAQTIYLVLGLMFGSLYAIAMGPASLDAPQPPLDAATLNIPALIAGAAVVLLLAAKKNKSEKRRSAQC